MEAKKDDMLVQRFAAYRLACAMAGSKAIGDIEKFWPVEMVEKSKPKKVSPELYKQIIERHKVKLKHGRSR